MPKLNAVNALVTGKKSEVEKGVMEVYKAIQKPDLFDGFSRTYRPLNDEDADQLPPENKRVQLTAGEAITACQKAWSELWDLTATQDAGNTHAKAKIECVPEAGELPVTTLLFLEKQINNVESFVSKLPTPDPGEEWSRDPITDLYKTDPIETVRTKKVVKTHVAYPATPEHPAQTQVYNEDVPAGRWTRVLFTGRIPARSKNEILARLKILKEDIKLAREKANLTDVDRKKIADSLFAYVFAGQ